MDYLVGLKENVILGHLVPAGTGFRTYQDSEVRIRPEALEALAAEKDKVLARTFPLLEGQPAEQPAASDGNGAQPTSETEEGAESRLEAMFGGSEETSSTSE